MNLILREIFEDGTDLLERLRSRRLELVLTGPKQIARGQIDEQALVIEIDGGILFFDLRLERSDQSILRPLQFSHFCGEFSAKAGEFLLPVGQLGLKI